MTELPERDNEESERIRVFISWLNGSKPYPAPIQIIRYLIYLVFRDILKISKPLLSGVVHKLRVKAKHCWALSTNF